MVIIFRFDHSALSNLSNDDKKNEARKFKKFWSF